MLLWPRLGGGLEALRRNPRSHSLNTPTRPKELAGLGYPSRPEKKARSNRPAPEPPPGSLQVGQADKLAEDKARLARGGPLGPEPSSEPMSGRNLGTPLPISARLEGAALDWVGADQPKGTSCQPDASPAPGAVATPSCQSREAPRWRRPSNKVGLNRGMLV